MSDKKFDISQEEKHRLNKAIALALGFKPYDIQNIDAETKEVRSLTPAWVFPPTWESHRYVAPTCHVPDFIEMLERYMCVLDVMQSYVPHDFTVEESK